MTSLITDHNNQLAEEENMRTLVVTHETEARPDSWTPDEKLVGTLAPVAVQEIAIDTTEVKGLLANVVHGEIPAKMVTGLAVGASLFAWTFLIYSFTSIATSAPIF